MERIPASKRTSQGILQALNGLAEGEGVSEVIRLGLRKIVEEALEAEVSDGIGRGYYERGAEGKSGYRNGYRRGRLKTAEGLVEYAVPQVSDWEEPFRSRIRGGLADRTQALEDLAVEIYARGLSTRDIEKAFRDEAGRTLLSKTAVSEVTERLWTECEAFATRDLSEHPLVYLFVHVAAERLRPGQPREAVLGACSICADGQKVLLHLAPGTKEDTESCKAFFQEGSVPRLVVDHDDAAEVLLIAPLDGSEAVCELSAGVPIDDHHIHHRAAHRALQRYSVSAS